MIQRDYLVIGAGVAGAAACSAIRQHDKKGSITLAGVEGHPPYVRTALSRGFLSAKNVDPASLYHLDSAWFAKNKIELRTDTLVKHFNVERHLAVFGPGQTVEFKKAVIATGLRPKRPSVGGVTLGNIFYLRTIRDALALREVIASEKNIVVIGGGFVAAEACASLASVGCKVTLMCRDQFLWQKRVDLETAKWLTTVLDRKGVHMMMQETLNGFEGKTIVRNIQAKSGNRFPAAAVLLACGTELNLELISNTPLGSPNGVPVNEYLETDEKGVYSAGDIALYPDRIFGGVRRCAHFNCAVTQGLVAGANITGKKRQKFLYVPHYESELAGFRFDFVGDFSMAPARTEMVGDHRSGKFTASYFLGDRLTGVVLCNRPLADVQTAIERFKPIKK